MGGARVTASLIDAGLVDEFRLIVYPLIAGAAKPLFATAERRHGLKLREVQQLSGGRVFIVFGVGTGKVSDDATTKAREAGHAA
jgi:riboflavin biosynthesis pyrimidine reductase